MKKISIILPFVIIALCFANCKINRQDKLIGSWKVVPFTDPDSATNVKYWIFYAGDRLEVYSLSTVDSLGNRPDSTTVIGKSDKNNSTVKTDSAIYASLASRNRKVIIGDTLTFEVFSYNTDGKIVNILSTDASADSKYIAGSRAICGEYWMDEVKKNKRLKLVRRKDPKGEKGGAYLRIELVKVKL
jgi:hypothetical protein